ncbi:MAG: WD40 repeat domain-containing protein, partial [Pseudomonadota bacterium]
PDGKLAAAGNANGSLLVFDLVSRKTEKTIEFADGAWIWSVAFVPDSERVAIGSISGVTVFDSNTGQEIHQFGGRGYVWDLSISDEYLALVTVSGEPCLWDLRMFAKIRCFATSIDDFGSGVLSQTGKQVAFSAEIPAVYDTRSSHKLSADRPSFLSDLVTFSPNGRFLFTSDSSGVRLIELDNAASSWSSEEVRSWEASDFAFSADSSRLALSDYSDNAIILINTEDGSSSRIEPSGKQATTLIFASNSYHLVSGSSRGALTTHDVNTFEEVARQELGTGEVNLLSIQPGGEALLAADADGVWCLYQGVDLNAKTCIERGAAAENGLLLPDGRSAVIVEVDSRGLYHGYEVDLITSEVTDDLGNFPPAVGIQSSGDLFYRDEELVSRFKDVSVARLPISRSGEKVVISDDGKLVFVLDIDGRLRVQSVELKASLSGREIGSVSAFSLCSSDGSEFAYITREGGIYISSVASDSPLANIPQNTRVAELQEAPYSAIACSFDGRYIAFADDTTVRVYDRRTSDDHTLWERQPSETDVLAMSPSGSELVLGGNTHGYIWNVGERIATGYLEDIEAVSRISAAAYHPEMNF